VLKLVYFKNSRNMIGLEKLEQKFNELKERHKLLDKKLLESRILYLAQINYDNGDKNAFKFAEQDLKIINRQ
jgi:hypothetical protein